MPCSKCLPSRQVSPVTITRTNCGCNAPIQIPPVECAPTIPEVIQQPPCLIQDSLPIVFEVCDDHTLELLIFKQSAPVQFSVDQLLFGGQTPVEQAVFVVCSESNGGCWNVSPTGVSTGVVASADCYSVVFHDIPPSYIQLSICPPVDEVCGTLTGNKLVVNSNFDLTDYLVKIDNSYYQIIEVSRLVTNQLELTLDRTPPALDAPCMCFSVGKRVLQIPGAVMSCTSYFHLPTTLPCGTYQAQLRILGSTDSYPIIIKKH